MHFNTEHFELIDSTNTYLFNKALTGAPEGTVVSADKQTGGRGRSGRTFFSPEGNLYMSILVRPNMPVSELHLLTPLCAVCVVRSIEEILNIKCDIKWVNDIYYNDKKICGILTELKLSGEKAEFAVVGIGINVFPIYNDELSDIAGSLLEDNSFYSIEDKRDIIAKLRNAVLLDFDKLYTNYNLDNFMPDYRACSNVIGKKVKYVTANNENIIEVLDIDDSGNLVAKDNNGEVKRFYDGEIRIQIQ